MNWLNHIAVSIGVFFSSLFGVSNHSQVTGSSTSTNVISTNQPATSTKVSSQDVIYSNSKYGFTLHLPNSLAGYKTTEQESSGSDSISFSLNNYENLFYIIVYSKAQWQAVLNDDYPAPDYLGENNSFVFASRSNQESTIQPPLSLRNDVKVALASFSLN